MTQPDIVVDVTLDGLELPNATVVGFQYGRLDTTLPSDGVINCKITDRKTYRVETDGGIYIGKAKRMEWREPIEDDARPGVTIFPVTIDTIYEWPDPCITCGLSHDTLDCGKSILPHPYHPEIVDGW